MAVVILVIMIKNIFQAMLILFYQSSIYHLLKRADTTFKIRLEQFSAVCFICYSTFRRVVLLANLMELIPSVLSSYLSSIKCHQVTISHNPACATSFLIVESSPVLWWSSATAPYWPSLPGQWGCEADKSETLDVIGVQPTECDRIDLSISPNKLV